MGLLALAAVAAFLAHEPLLVVLGHRGRRRMTEDGPRARARLLLLIAAAIGLGATGLAIAPPGTLAIAAIVAVPVVAAIGCGYRRVAHTLPGEMVAAIALTSAAVVVHVAGGATRSAALACCRQFAGCARSASSPRQPGWSRACSRGVAADRRPLQRGRRSARTLSIAAASTCAGSAGIRPDSAPGMLDGFTSASCTVRDDTSSRITK